MSHRDKKFQASYAGKPCHVCGEEETTVCAHLLTVGSRPDLATNPKNCMALCYAHHQMQESNLSAFVWEYRLEDEMLERGFYLRVDEDGRKKWDFPYRIEYESWLDRKTSRKKRRKSRKNK